jgi:hypothetical protein
MCRSVARVTVVAAAIVVAFASVVRAEAIQIVYKIDIFQLCEYRSVGETCRDVRTSFPLTLTFDSQIVNGYGDDLDRVRFYGPPSVSDIPLPRRTDFPPVVETQRQAAERAQFDAGLNAWRRESSVLIRHGGSRDGSDFHRDVSLIAHGEFSSVPVLNAQSFAQFLGTAPFRQFNVADSVELASGGFEAISYYGHVSLDSPVVTPEPGSLLLLATGLGTLTVRRRSRQGRTDGGSCRPQDPED